MIKLLGSLPKTLTLAVSGGIDSMVLLDFASRKHDVQVAFFHHGTTTSSVAHEFLSKFCSSKGLELIVGNLATERPPGTSIEEHWRDERYSFLSQFATVATAHHLDDCVETWVWSSLHGTPKLIPYRRGNVIRPFLCTRKSEMLKWAQKNAVTWIEDLSNLDVTFTRNFIRHEMMEGVLKVNPGIHTMIERKLRVKFTSTEE